MALTMVLKACGGLSDLGAFMVVLVSPFGAAHGDSAYARSLVEQVRGGTW